MPEQSATDRYVREITEDLVNDFANVLKKEEVIEVVNQRLTGLSGKATVMDFIGILLQRSSRAELRRLAASKDLVLI